MIFEIQAIWQTANVRSLFNVFIVDVGKQFSPNTP